MDTNPKPIVTVTLCALQLLLSESGETSDIKLAATSIHAGVAHVNLADALASKEQGDQHFVEIPYAVSGCIGTQNKGLSLHMTAAQIDLPARRPACATATLVKATLGSESLPLEPVSVRF